MEAIFSCRSAGYILPSTYRPGNRQELRRRCRLHRASLSENWLYSSSPIATGAVISVDACAFWRRAAFLVRQAQSPRNNMDVKCEPSCVFSTGSCSDSVRELACKPAQQPANSPCLAARSPLRCCFYNWVSCGCCRWTLSVLSSCSPCAFFPAALFRRQQRRPAASWRHRATPGVGARVYDCFRCFLTLT